MQDAFVETFDALIGVKLHRPFPIQGSLELISDILEGGLKRGSEEEEAARRWRFSHSTRQARSGDGKSNNPPS